MMTHHVVVVMHHMVVVVHHVVMAVMHHRGFGHRGGAGDADCQNHGSKEGLDHGGFLKVRPRFGACMQDGDARLNGG